MSHLDELIAIFHADAAELGEFTAVAAADMPEVARKLLAHEQHMTVTVEDFHRSLVNVEVLRIAESRSLYAREILLRARGNNNVVQYGIVRMDLSTVNDNVRRDIESRHIPLGRVLIEHNVLRQVELLQLYRILPGPALRGYFDSPAAEPVYGRTALIHCDGSPAVELLEIVRI